MRWRQRKERERQLDAELRFHWEEQVAEHIRQGLSEVDAQRRARLELGSMTQVREEYRDARGTRVWEDLGQDLRYAARGFVHTPRFALSAIAALALAVGVATAVFSVVDQSLFRALPYTQDNRLVSLGIVAPVISSQDWLFAVTYQEWQKTQTAFAALTAWKGVGDCDRQDNEPERLTCAQVEAGFLSTLGVQPWRGRNFYAGEEGVGLISYGYWQSRFGEAPTVLGQRLRLDGANVTIVGVLPRDFETPTLAPADVLLPLNLKVGTHRQRLVNVIGRLRERESVASASERMQPLFRQFVATVPADFRQAVPMQLRLVTLRDAQTRGHQLALWMLLGAALLFVLTGCANVAHLLLARAANRRPEFAIRASLGASSGRLAQQALTEGALLGVAGCVLGCGLAYGCLRAFQSLAPEGTLRMSQAALDFRVLAFALVLSLVATLLFGAAPALERWQVEVGSSVPHRRRAWLRPALAGLQLALSLVLLTGTGLFLLSLSRLQLSRLGFAPERVVTASFILPAQAYASDASQIAFFQDLERRLEASPGTVSSAITDTLPPGGDPRSRPFVALVSGGDAANLTGLVKWRYVTRGYFATMGIAIPRGRAFASEDRQAIVISESLARRLYPDTDPIGKRLKLDGAMPEIVGIAAGVRNAGLTGETDPEFYVLRGDKPEGAWRNQRPPFGWRQATAVVRSNLPEPAAIRLLSQTIHQAEPTLALRTGTLRQQVESYVAGPRFQTALLALFGWVSLVLAAIGLYGLTSFLAAERTREFGVRLALGATAGGIVRLVMREGLVWTAAGIACGTLASMAITQSLRSLLFEVEPLDPRAFLGAAGLLAMVALVGVTIPAVRASRVDPIKALRQD